MRSVIQRVGRAAVRADGRLTGEIGAGLVALIGAHRDDGPDDCDWTARKIVELRIFDDDSGRLDRGLREAGGAVLAVSQFTLLGDCRRGRRPSWSEAMEPERARQLFDRTVALMRSRNVRVETGLFGASMVLELVNEGPVTVILDSRETA